MVLGIIISKTVARREVGTTNISEGKAGYCEIRVPSIHLIAGMYLKEKVTHKRASKCKELLEEPISN